jgi:hypothetical protein
MTTNSTDLKSFVISSHPYAFDAMFVSSGQSDNRWTGTGHVVFHASGGGVNNVWALIEADDAGYDGLQKAGFNVQAATRGRYTDVSGATYIVKEDGELTYRESALREEEKQNPPFDKSS